MSKRSLFQMKQTRIPATMLLFCSFCWIMQKPGCKKHCYRDGEAQMEQDVIDVPVRGVRLMLRKALKWTVFYLGFYITIFVLFIPYTWSDKYKFLIWIFYALESCGQVLNMGRIKVAAFAVRKKDCFTGNPCCQLALPRVSWFMTAACSRARGLWLENKGVLGFRSYETWVQNINSGCICTRKHI